MRAAEAASSLRIARQSERKSLELFQIIPALASVTLPIGGRDRVAGLQLNPPMTAEGESGRRPRTQSAPKLDPRFRSIAAGVAAHRLTLEPQRPPQFAVDLLNAKIPIETGCQGRRFRPPQSGRDP
jgi:hypothetical protein